MTTIDESIAPDLYAKYPDLETFDLTFAGSSQLPFVNLNMIKVTSPREGIGTKVMTDFCQYLDNVNLPCRLTPDPLYGTPYLKLIEWYTRFGFEDYDIARAELIRYPKNFPEHLKPLY